LIGAFWFFLFRGEDLSKSNLAVINDNVDSFSFIDQNGSRVTERDVEGKVYVAEYFFTTCKGICPKMNANMRRVFEAYKDEPNFMILSHTCMPETDSVPLLKAYETRMITGDLVKNADGSYRVELSKTQKPPPDPDKTNKSNPNWLFLTGDKTALYRMARQSYLIDNNKPDSMQNISDQFIHTQFFALVDKARRVRGIYDGLKEDEIEKLLGDIKDLLKEKIDHKHFMNGFSNNPN
jgi:protein SCO1/2